MRVNLNKADVNFLFLSRLFIFTEIAMKQIMSVKGLNLEDVLSSVQNSIPSTSLFPADYVNSQSNGARTKESGMLIDQLDASRIYSLETIRKVCIDYRLRFLDLNYFRGELPVEATEEILRLEEEHQTILESFKIMAPSKMFKLEDKDDPMLFAPLGNGYYYLIHKWGGDLHPWRKWMVWPFKGLSNFMVMVFLISVVCTLLTPMSVFTKDYGMVEKLILFLFVFKSVIAVFIYFGFASGKNFNSVIWNSKYYNA